MTSELHISLLITAKMKINEFEPIKDQGHR